MNNQTVMGTVLVTLQRACHYVTEKCHGDGSCDTVKSVSLCYGKVYHR